MCINQTRMSCKAPTKACARGIPVLLASGDALSCSNQTAALCSLKYYVIHAGTVPQPCLLHPAFLQHPSFALCFGCWHLLCSTAYDGAVTRQQHRPVSCNQPDLLYWHLSTPSKQATAVEVMAKLAPGCLKNVQTSWMSLHVVQR